MTVKRFIILLMIVTLTLAIIVWGIKSNVEKLEDSSKDKDNAFVSQIGDDVFVNTGLTVQRIQSGTGTKRVSIVVLNHSSEPMIFRDRSFEMVVYYYENDLSSWKVVGPIISTREEKFVLPAKTEVLDFNIPNWTMLSYERMLPVSFSGPFRLSVRGVGQDTGKKFLAYLDIEE